MVRVMIVDAPLVRRLVRDQFPDWADLPLQQVISAGTDNAIFRLGDALAVRLPRMEWATEQVSKEQLWLPRLAPALPLEIPAPLAHGQPTEEYPWTWSILRWIEGQTISGAGAALPDGLPAALAEFLKALRAADTHEAPRYGAHNHYRGAPLAKLDGRVRTAIQALECRMDVAEAVALWEELARTPPWLHAPVWVHGDLHGQNLLARTGRLAAVIDFGLLGVGDPAADLIVAWNLLSENAREKFRRLLGLDDATWARGRAWALYSAVIALSFYWDSNPILARASRTTLEQVLTG